MPLSVNFGIKTLGDVASQVTAEFDKLVGRLQIPVIEALARGNITPGLFMVQYSSLSNMLDETAAGKLETAIKEAIVSVAATILEPELRKASPDMSYRYRMLFANRYKLYSVVWCRISVRQDADNNRFMCIGNHLPEDEDAVGWVLPYAMAADANTLGAFIINLMTDVVRFIDETSVPSIDFLAFDKDARIWLARTFIEFVRPVVTEWLETGQYEFDDFSETATAFAAKMNTVVPNYLFGRLRTGGFSESSLSTIMKRSKAFMKIVSRSGHDVPEENVLDHKDTALQYQLMTELNKGMRETISTTVTIPVSMMFSLVRDSEIKDSVWAKFGKQLSTELTNMIKYGCAVIFDGMS